ncbi:hypothetical protein D3C73_1576050 [compost metagenome]
MEILSNNYFGGNGNSVPGVNGNNGHNDIGDFSFAKETGHFVIGSIRYMVAN